MNVTQCDICGNVVKNEQSMYLEVHRVTSDNTVGARLTGKEICPACWERISKLITPKGDKS